MDYWLHRAKSTVLFSFLSFSILWRLSFLQTTCWNGTSTYSAWIWRKDRAFVYRQCRLSLISSFVAELLGFHQHSPIDGRVSEYIRSTDIRPRSKLRFDSVPEKNIEVGLRSGLCFVWCLEIWMSDDNREANLHPSQRCWCVIQELKDELCQSRSRFQRKLLWN
jgi:hypothetical protein